MPTKIKQLESSRDFKQRSKFHPLYSLNEFFIFEEDSRTSN